MDFQYCPKCEAFNSPGATHCEQCKAELPQVEDFAPTSVAQGSDVPAESGEGEPLRLAVTAGELPAEPPPAAELPDFEAAPEVLAKVAALEAQIQEKPGANGLYLQLAQVYQTGGRKDLAVRTLERCVERDPNNVYMRHRLAQLTGTPDSGSPAPPAGAPAASSPTAAQPRQETAAAALAARPAYHRPPPRRRVSRWAILGGVAGALVLAVGVKLVLFPGPKQVVTGAFSAVSPKWSPTGRQFAFVMVDDSGARLGVYDVREDAMRTLAAISGGDASAFAWSPDGQRIAYVGSTDQGDWNEAVFVADVATGNTRRVRDGGHPAWVDSTTLLMWCAAEGGELAEAVYAEEGELVAPTVSYGPSRLPGPCRVNAATGEVTRHWPESDQVTFGWGSVVSPLLGKVAYERADEAQMAAAPASPAGTTSVDGEFVEMVDSVAARGATNLYEGSRDLDRELRARQRQEKRTGEAGSTGPSDVYVADLDGGTEVRLTTDGRSRAPAWTADGQRLLYVSAGALWMVNADGSGRQQLFEGAMADPPEAQLSRDGRRVFFLAPVAGDPGVAALMTGEAPFDLHVARVGSAEAERLANRHPFKRRYALSPDGKRIVYEFLAETGSMVRGGSRSELWMMRP